VRLLNRSDVVAKEALPEWAVITGNRSGRTLHVMDAYRVKRQMLTQDDSALNTPLDLFRAFCDAAGCDLTIGAKKIGKFLVYERIPDKGQLTAVHPSSHKVQVSSWFRQHEDGFELAFAYAIDLTLYKQLLAQRQS
jgi:hypothetical protein